MISIYNDVVRRPHVPRDRALVRIMVANGISVGDRQQQAAEEGDSAAEDQVSCNEEEEQEEEEEATDDEILGVSGRLARK